jgi:hypothetical protein
MITPAQCLAARSLLNWSRYRLAARCDQSYDFIRTLEIGARVLSPEQNANIRAALEEAGVEFTNGGELGVKLRQQP